ncbi:MAG: hypothetical protein Q8L07_01605 [Sediminibacterium sp.]|nr:hypothetical protein [Sediminibacterium sp.]MDP1812106.1 hypothetical protein [Sediminibacterium sp.]MDP3127024.1 hypothetical protein [Sediminibacterium sp.]
MEQFKQKNNTQESGNINKEGKEKHESFLSKYKGILSFVSGGAWGYLVAQQFQNEYMATGDLKQAAAKGALWALIGLISYKSSEYEYLLKNKESE